MRHSYSIEAHLARPCHKGYLGSSINLHLSEELLACRALVLLLCRTISTWVQTTLSSRALPATNSGCTSGCSPHQHIPTSFVCSSDHIFEGRTGKHDTIASHETPQAAQGLCQGIYLFRCTCQHGVAALLASLSDVSDRKRRLAAWLPCKLPLWRAISVSKRCFHSANVCGVTMVPCDLISASLLSSASSSAFLAAAGSTGAVPCPLAAACMCASTECRAGPLHNFCAGWATSHR